VIVIDKKHCPNANFENAEQFTEWITGGEAQRLIGEFKLLGKPLFTPNTK
jgi:tungstate transport system substrate-binding protein